MSDDKTIEARVTISRRQGYENDGTITISLRDESSRIEFAEIEMTSDAFVSALTGAGMVAAKGVVRGLDRVGKTKVIEKRSVLYAGDKWDSAQEKSQWLEAHCKEPGWYVNTYLGSQGTQTYGEAGVTLHYSVYKFVDTEA